VANESCDNLFHKLTSFFNFEQKLTHFTEVNVTNGPTTQQSASHNISNSNKLNCFYIISLLTKILEQTTPPAA